MSLEDVQRARSEDCDSTFVSCKVLLRKAFRGFLWALRRHLGLFVGIVKTFGTFLWALLRCSGCFCGHYQGIQDFCGH
jgi:hypothetical protein